MKKLTFLLTITLLTSCSPLLTVTNLNTQQPRRIKVKKINAIILKNGMVYEDNIRISTGRLTADGMMIGPAQISTIEVKKIRFGDAVAFPLEATGVVAAAGGLLVWGAALADDSAENLGSALIVGGVLLGGGVGLNRLGHAMRPKDGNSIESLNSTDYNFEHVYPPTH
ncbi:MAG: hypothetical protein RIC35_10745 [Marinoscillum sp.]